MLCRDICLRYYDLRHRHLPKNFRHLRKGQPVNNPCRGLTSTRQLDTPAHAVSLDRLDSYSTTGARKARQARPQQRLDSRLDSTSTEPRQLDSSTARAQAHTFMHLCGASHCRLCHCLILRGGWGYPLSPSGVAASSHRPANPAIRLDRTRRL
jgi:hypothetical protein